MTIDKKQLDEVVRRVTEDQEEQIVVSDIGEELAVMVPYNKWCALMEKIR